MKQVKIKLLKGNGSFASEECLKFLKEADVVVTNPPFSLFREFFNLLVREKKKFLLVGSLLNYFKKDIAKQIIRGGVRPGRSIRNATLKFLLPDGNLTKMTSIEWLTNLHEWYPEPLTLTATYSPDKYPKYDNYDAIESKVKDIPKDYDGVLGVPISFIDKWCPQQFEVLDICRPYLKGKRLFARFLIKRRQNGLKNAE